MPTNTAFSVDYLKKIRALLEEQKVVLEKQLAQFSERQAEESGMGDGTGKFPDYGTAEEDSAQEVADYEANLSIEQDLQKSLRDVVSALQRLDNNAYGICRYCKKPIDEKRLLARPTSSACVECKKAIVQEA